MRAFSLGLIAIPIAALTLAGAGDRLSAKDLSAKEMMRFGVEAAKHGLWREALFRWERTVQRDPDNARLRNNLAVAYESLGDYRRAGEQYKEALRLDPGNDEILENYESFKQLERTRRRVAGEAPEASP